MKTFNLTIIFFVLVIICTAEIHAQAAETNLNQVELMKQFMGVWKCEFGKDTVVISETKDFGNGALEMYQKWLCRGKLLFEQKMLWGYDKKNDKYICARIKNNNPAMALIIFWFIANNICKRIPYEYLDNAEQAPTGAVYEFKTTDLMVAAFYNKDKVTGTFTWHKIKD